MIRLRGTSHVASGDLADIRELVRERRPAVVAVELDELRLQALMSDVPGRRAHNPFLLLLQVLQQWLGKKTGAAPGSDMVTAVEEAYDVGCDVALIDRDIRETMQRVKADVPWWEKVKLAGFMVVGPFVLEQEWFDPREVPEGAVVERALLQLEVSFPSLYEVLVAERNRVMAARLQALEDAYGDVLAFVGMGHLAGLTELLDADVVR